VIPFGSILKTEQLNDIRLNLPIYDNNDLFLFGDENAEYFITKLKRDSNNELNSLSIDKIKR
jgi:hypothetical protein